MQSPGQILQQFDTISPNITGCKSYHFFNILLGHVDRKYNSPPTSFLHENTKDWFITFPNNERRVENTTRSEVFLSNFKLFGNVVKHCLECLIYFLKRD